MHQRGGIEHRFLQLVDLTAKTLAAKHAGVLLQRQRCHATAHQLAGEETRHARSETGSGPEILVIGHQAHAAKVDLAVSFQTGTPQRRHAEDRLAGIAHRAGERILGTVEFDKKRKIKTS